MSDSPEQGTTPLLRGEDIISALQNPKASANEKRAALLQIRLAIDAMRQDLDRW